MVRVTTSMTVRAPQETVFGVFTDVPGWPAVFPKISGVRDVRVGRDRVDVIVEHSEGDVPNTLLLEPPDRAVLEESKRRYDARFVNEIKQRPDGSTVFTVHAQIHLKGWRRALGPVLGWYVRRQLRRFTLAPVARAAEATTADRDRQEK